MGPENRRHLVIVRAGEKSIHQRWLTGASDRNWDLIVSYYGDDPEQFRADDCIRIDGKGPKLRGLYNLITAQPDLFRKYDYIWLPEDDLDCNAGDINRLFEICREAKYDLAQPSLRPDGIFTHPLTLHNPAFRWRNTSFVEVMCPCVPQAMFWQLLPTFNSNISGWGVDFLWSKLFPPEKAKVGIIDEVQICHTRPLGTGSLYKLLIGKTPQQEMAELLEKHGISHGCFKVHGGVTASGRTIQHPLIVLLFYVYGLIAAEHNGKFSPAWVRYLAGAVWQQLKPAPRYLASPR